MSHIFPFEFILETNGEGCWSKVATKVKTTILELIANPEDEYGEVRLYFDPTTWNIQTDGLIYTDPGFINDFYGALETTGFDDSDIYYSEQGMQGIDYVSFDVGSHFINSWFLNEEFNRIN